MTPLFRPSETHNLKSISSSSSACLAIIMLYSVALDVKSKPWQPNLSFNRQTM